MVEPRIVVVTFTVLVVIVEPVAVENDNISLDIAPDLLSNTVMVEPVAVEKFKLRTLI